MPLAASLASIPSKIFWASLAFTVISYMLFHPPPFLTFLPGGAFSRAVPPLAIELVDGAAEGCLSFHLCCARISMRKEGGNSGQ